MKVQNTLPVLLIFILMVSPEAQATTIEQTMEGGMNVHITYPDTVVVGRTISIAFLIENNGWEDKQDIIFIFHPDNFILPIEKTEIRIEKISAGGSYGETVEFKITSSATLGTHFLNVDYSQVLVANNEKPQPPTRTNIAIPVVVKDQPSVTIHTRTPESLFTNAEFPFTIEIISEDTNINNVKLEIIAPKDIDFRGEALHTFSSIQQNVPISVTSRIITPSQEIDMEHKIPFQVIVTYTDDEGKEKIDSKSISLVMRPRNYMELTTDGGIWVGDFFIAPYISLGTVVGIPVGTIISLAIRRSQKKKRKRKKSK